MCKNVTVLMKYEWKKLWLKRRVWIAVAVVAMFEILLNLSFLTRFYGTAIRTSDGAEEVFMESGYERMVRDRSNARDLDGRQIDDALLSEMRRYAKGYIRTRKGDDRKYEQIYRLLIGVWKNPDLLMDGNAADLYADWRELVRQRGQSFYLSREETAYWEGRMERMEEPLTYRYAFSWKNVLEQTLPNGIMVLMLIAVCLSGMFADEHQFRTDQLLLCMKNGKNTVYWVKMAVGILFGVCCTLLVYGISFAICFALYGAEGFDALLRLDVLAAPFDLSVGEAVLIMFGLSLLAGMLESALACFLSERLGSNVAVMAVMVGLMLLTQFAVIPREWRGLSQLWELMPTSVLNRYKFEDGRTVALFGEYLTCFQCAAFVYPAVTALFVWLGKRRYLRSQVTGR